MWDEWTDETELPFDKGIIEKVLEKLFIECDRGFYPNLVSVYPLRANEFRLEPWRAGLDIQPFDFIMNQIGERSYEVHVFHTTSHVVVVGNCKTLGLTEELTIQDDTLDFSDKLKGWKFVINI
jgi:hypothetical protein